MSLIKHLGLAIKNSYSRLLQKLNALKGSPQKIAKGFATGVAMSKWHCSNIRNNSRKPVDISFYLVFNSSHGILASR